MRINYNVSAMLTNNALANNDNLLSQSLQRLSTGLKINSAKDNPAGMAMAKRMNAQLESLSVANNNASDGVSIMEIADGAMSEMSEMLQRLNELAIKSANGLEADADRSVIQKEVNQLTDEINRVAETTEFNGQRLLNGEFSLKGYVNGNLDVKVSSYTKEVSAGIYKIDSLVIEENPLPADESERYKVTMNLGGTDNGGFPKGATASIKDNLVTIQGVNGFELTLDLTGKINKEIDAGTFPGAPITISDLEVNVTGIGAMKLQIGANEGQILEVDIPEISLREMGIEDLDVSTQESATEAIDRIDGAVQFLSSVRGHLGAYQNRLESTISTLDVSYENMTAAYSRIMDVDMAEEMTNYTTYQVMTQAATSMLAQANERPSQVLQLLQ
ncbi:flagellin N-terminal helical domain-containing protein [Acetatifactor muris]|uniref:flagellin N-terminal helical domain-containing protein n=1 Tax=Acetatifactor muris TaxID=879566 RepID=UPI0023F28BAE|nr:flagellin [Acetatifactor muris]MCI8801395.1 flagellin FliC3 [Lachnospiraceae bacterium]